jgi:hypothetical protein
MSQDHLIVELSTGTCPHTSSGNAFGLSEGRVASPQPSELSLMIMTGAWMVSAWTLSLSTAGLIPLIVLYLGQHRPKYRGSLRLGPRSTLVEIGNLARPTSR